MRIDVQRRGLACGVLEAIDSESVLLRLPHTDYRLQLRPTVPTDELAGLLGKRVRGTIEAVAQKIHPAAGGGGFIEPIEGEPRIVAGTVLMADEEARRVLIDAAIPVWLTAQEGQDFGAIRSGGLVNCYVLSGARFTPQGV